MPYLPLRGYHYLLEGGRYLGKYYGPFTTHPPSDGALYMLLSPTLNKLVPYVFHPTDMSTKSKNV